MFDRSTRILVLAAALLLALPNTAFANHCSARFLKDIGPAMQPPSGGVQTVAGNCTGQQDCSDYFDIVMAAGDQLTVGFCATGAFADFNPDIAIFAGSFVRSCNSSFNCSEGPQTIFTAPAAGTFRVRIGHNFGSGGAYVLAYTAPRSTEIVGAIPICFEIDAIDDQFSLINDGTTKSYPVLNNDECDGDRPISVVMLPGDLAPDRGGVAITDGTNVLYTPSSGYVGFEEFSYTAQDAGLEGGEAVPSVDQDTARVIVNVLEDLAPDAVDDEASVVQGIATAIDVLANDFPGNEPSSIAVASPPAHGSATLQGNDSFRYISFTNFFGPDSFEYRLTDANGDTDVASVSLAVAFLRGVVPIDVMPRDDGNNLNLRAGPGSGFELAILSDAPYFDAPAQIDPLSLKLGPRQANIWGDARSRDADGDGDLDLVVKFLTDQTGIRCGDTTVSLTGRTYATQNISAQSISGSDAVNTFNCSRVRRHR